MLAWDTTGGPRAELRELVGIGIGIGIEWRRTWRLGMSSWIVAMLTRLGQRGYSVKEEPAEYRIETVDTDSDPE